MPRKKAHAPVKTVPGKGALATAARAAEKAAAAMVNRKRLSALLLNLMMN